MSMVVTEKEQAEFLKVYFALMFYVWIGVSTGEEAPTFFSFMSEPDFVREGCREVIYLEDRLIDDFIDDNDGFLDENSLELLDNIYAGLLADFIVLKATNEFAILYQAEEKKFYKVANITGPLREIVPHIPIKIRTAIVDFKGRIVCDGFISNSDKMIASAFVTKLNKEYEKAVAAGTVVTLLD